MKFIVTGSHGRMGKSIVEILKSKNLDVVEVNRTSPLKNISDKKAAVLIDFTTPNFFEESLNWCINNNVAFVSGSTGLEDSHFLMLKDAAKKIPVLWSPNMSIGVAFLNNLLQQFKTIASNFDFQIEEFHHIHKKDQPSGTGKLLQKSLKESVGENIPEVLSIRGGGIFGVHKVWAMSEEETLLLEHTALNREVFAKGAIICAQWIGKKPAGNYNINEVLGLN